MKTEQQTRKEFIDIALKKAGWNVNDPGQVIQEYDIIVDPTQVAEACTPYGGHQLFSDPADPEPLCGQRAAKARPLPFRQPLCEQDRAHSAGGRPRHAL